VGKRELSVDVKTQNNQVPDFTLNLSSSSKVRAAGTGAFRLCLLLSGRC
jgi:hypothetical protein